MLITRSYCLLDYAIWRPRKWGIDNNIDSWRRLEMQNRVTTRPKMHGHLISIFLLYKRTSPRDHDGNRPNHRTRGSLSARSFHRSHPELQRPPHIRRRAYSRTREGAHGYAPDQTLPSDPNFEGGPLHGPQPRVETARWVADCLWLSEAAVPGPRPTSVGSPTAASSCRQTRAVGRTKSSLNPFERAKGKANPENWSNNTRRGPRAPNTRRGPT